MIAPPIRVILTTFILASGGLVSGCGTIVHWGGTEELNVTSVPSGAKLVVDGAERGVTPMALKVERKQPHKIQVSKEGYEESESSIDSKVSWWMAGNAVIGGIVGILVDVMSGGGYTIEPDTVAVSLKPVEGIGTSPAPSLSSLTQSPPIP